MSVKYNMHILDMMIFRIYKKHNYEPISWDLDDVSKIFEWYFWFYEKRCGRKHPNISSEQIEKIVLAMPTLNSDGAGAPEDIDPDDYLAIIEQHFKTPYSGYGVDYNINHFFSGDIRLMRFYEIM